MTMSSVAENSERIDRVESRLDRLELRIGKLEGLLTEIAGMAKLLRWLFAALLLIGGGPIVVEKVKLFLTAAAAK
jgi:hypothetical protein